VGVQTDCSQVESEGRRFPQLAPFPILHRLESDGLIGARWGESETGRKRKYYHLLPAAEPVLAEERQQWNVVNLLLARLWEPQTP